MDAPATHTRMIDTLARRFADHLYTQDGIAYPAAFFPTAPDTPPESVLRGTPSTHTDADDFAFYDSQHLARLRTSRKHLTNGLSYVFESLTVADGHISLTGRLGRYFDMLATCDALDHELRNFALRGGEGALLHRQALHQRIDYAAALSSGEGRCAIIGGATLTVYNDGGNYHLLLAQRSGGVATGANLYHVLPAFVLQPSRNLPEFIRAEWSITHQVMREFAEELFGMSEIDAWQPTPTDPTYFYDHPPVAALREMLDDGRAELHVLGMAMNLLSMRAEVCTLLLIHDADWYSHWQADLNAAIMTERQATHRIPLATLDGIPPDLHLHVTPHGALTLWEGIKRARAVLSGA